MYVQIVVLLMTKKCFSVFEFNDSQYIMRLSSNGRYMEHTFPANKGPHREELFEAIDGALADIEKRLNEYLSNPKTGHVVDGIYIGDLGIVYTYYILGDPCWERLLKGLQRSLNPNDHRVTILESNMFASIMEGNEDQVCEYAQRAIQMDAKECEVLYGRAGCLLGLLFAKRRHPGWRLDDHIRTLARQIVLAGKASNRVHLMWEWHSKEYLGAIHGVAGILLTLCLCGREMLEEIEPGANELIKSTADFMLSRYSHSSGNVQSSTSTDADLLVHFCHGATGWIPLICTLDKMFPGLYVEHAKRLGEVVWRRGIIANKGPGICHGTSGSICALLEIFTQTGDDEWLHKAQWFSFYVSENWKRFNPLADRPNSLFEGMCGAFYALSLTHILTGDRTRFTNSTSLFPGFII